ncbi:MAG: hypothetical protein ACXV5H_09325 [Halobacteriota archaeon]
MPKYMTIWRLNPSAPWPIDPTEAKQRDEMRFAFLDEGLKSGQLLEVGWFANGTSGYVISSGEDAKGVLAMAFAAHPWFQREVHEIIDYETGKEIERQVLNAQAERTAAMKR